MKVMTPYFCITSCHPLSKRFTCRRVYYNPDTNRYFITGNHAADVTDFRMWWRKADCIEDVVL